MANTATNALSTANLQAKFDASSLGNALISAARDGVDRLKDQSSSLSGSASGSRAVSPPPLPPGGPGGAGGNSGVSELSISGVADSSNITTGNVNQNLRNLGKFFRRDLNSFSGRFGRGEEGK